MGSVIANIGYYLPNVVVTNESLSKEFGRWEAEKIELKLGIKERYIANSDETAGDLAYYAAKKVLDNYNIEKIDMLILCTQSPDYFLPTTACILQDRLGLKTSIGAFDFNLGCSGYIYGLAMAKSFIQSEIANNVLLLTTETYSKHIHPKDLANRTIFGDAATATIIEKSEKEHFYKFVLGTNGKGKNNLIVNNGCFRNKYNNNAEEMITEAGDVYTENNLYMNGPEIFNFTIESVPLLIEQCLYKNNFKMQDIDYVIFHQANKFMIEYLRKKIQIPKDKFYSDMLHTGNTVSNTIPIAYAKAKEEKIIKAGDKILLCGFGVGYSWGATIIEV